MISIPVRRGEHYNDTILASDLRPTAAEFAAIYSVYSGSGMPATGGGVVYYNNIYYMLTYWYSRHEKFEILFKCTRKTACLYYNVPHILCPIRPLYSYIRRYVHYNNISRCVRVVRDYTYYTKANSNLPKFFPHTRSFIILYVVVVPFRDFIKCTVFIVTF